MKWIIFVLLAGCAQVTSLNMRKHQFGITPSKIIWFQIAGLEEEQFAMLRFDRPAERRTSFEENICIGKTWGYDLYQIRPPSQNAFLSQITGKKNIKGSCEDVKLKPIWQYLSGHGYKTGILEIGASKEQSLYSLKECQEGHSFIDDPYLWFRQTSIKGEETFHYSEEIPFKPGRPFYDRTCSDRNCISSVLDDFKAIYHRLNKNSVKHLLIVRDFSYLTALNRKDFKEARRILADIERTYTEAMNYSKESADYLILLTTGDSRFVDMPDQGKNWFEFEKQGTGPVLKKSKLTNLVLASGARAENFCGIYEDSHVFERILSGPKQQGLELKIINPFR